MAKAPDKEIELHPDAWGRFERAIDTAVKSPPQHRKVKGGKTKKKPSAAKNKQSR